MSEPIWMPALRLLASGVSDPVDAVGVAGDAVRELETRDACIRELEARLAACVGALMWANGETTDWPERQPGEGAYYWRKHLRKKWDSPDLACWRDLVGAARECSTVFGDEDAGPRRCERAVDKLIDAARTCGLGG